VGQGEKHHPMLFRLAGENAGHAKGFIRKGDHGIKIIIIITFYL